MSIKVKITVGKYSVRESAKVGFVFVENWETEEGVQIPEYVFEEYLKELVERER